MHKKKPEDFSMGEWASRMKGGIRKYKVRRRRRKKSRKLPFLIPRTQYSLNHTLSPETYKTLDGPSYFGVHASPL